MGIPADAIRVVVNPIKQNLCAFCRREITKAEEFMLVKVIGEERPLLLRLPLDSFGEIECLPKQLHSCSAE